VIDEVALAGVAHDGLLGVAQPPEPHRQDNRKDQRHGSDPGGRERDYPLR
jgi:hypothetical protein